jgi:hypothetical protein
MLKANTKSIHESDICRILNSSDELSLKLKKLDHRCVANCNEVFSALINQIDSEKISCRAILGGKELRVDHKKSLVKYMLANNKVSLIEALLNDKSKTDEIQQVIRDALIELDLDLQNNYRARSVLIDALFVQQQKQFGLSNAITNAFNGAADNVHAYTRPNGIPDGTVTAAVTVGAATLLFGAPLVASAAFAFTTATFSRNFGSKDEENSYDTKSSIDVDDEYKVLMSFHQVLIDMQNPTFLSVLTHGKFMAANLMQIKYLKDRLIKAEPIEPTIISNSEGCVIIFTDSRGQLKIGVKKGILNAQSSQINAFNLDEIHQFSDAAPTPQQFKSLTREVVQLIIGDKISIVPSANSSLKFQKH